jgi:hypothetical protein
MEDIVPKWLIQLLKWAGIAVAVISAIALIYVEMFLPTPEAGAAPGQITAPVQLYWGLLVVGIVAAIVGFVVERRKPAAGGEG